MFCGYWPAAPPVQPVKLVAVVPVHVIGPDAPKAMMFAPAVKFAVLTTPIVEFGRVRGFPVSFVGPVSTYDVPVTFFSRRRPLPSRPYTLYEVAPAYSDQVTVIVLVSPDATVSVASVPG